MPGMKALRDKLGQTYKGSTVQMAAEVGDVEFYPTGLPCFDMMVGGMPQGRLVLMTGRPGSGKSAWCYRAMGMAEQSLLIDSEGSYTSSWGALFGLNDDNLVVVRPKDMEECYNIVDQVLREYDLNYVVIDSAAGMSPRGEMARNLDDSKGYAERAVLNNQLCRRIVARTRQHQRTTTVLIQHLYENMNPQGKKWIISGGNTQQYLNSIHLQMSVARVLTEEVEGADGNETRTIGFVLRWQIDHSKVSSDGANGLWRLFTRNPADETMPRIGYSDDAPELLRQAALAGLVAKRGSWYALWPETDQETKVQGEVAAMQLVADHGDEMVGPLREALLYG